MNDYLVKVKEEIEKIRIHRIIDKVYKINERLKSFVKSEMIKKKTFRQIIRNTIDELFYNNLNEIYKILKEEDIEEGINDFIIEFFDFKSIKAITQEAITDIVYDEIKKINKRATFKNYIKEMNILLYSFKYLNNKYIINYITDVITSVPFIKDGKEYYIEKK